VDALPNWVVAERGVFCVEGGLRLWVQSELLKDSFSFLLYVVWAGLHEACKQSKFFLRTTWSYRDAAILYK
jgi:hypothetical protein